MEISCWRSSIVVWENWDRQSTKWREENQLHLASLFEDLVRNSYVFLNWHSCSACAELLNARVVGSPVSAGHNPLYVAMMLYCSVSVCLGSQRRSLAVVLGSWLPSLGFSSLLASRFRNCAASCPVESSSVRSAWSLLVVYSCWSLVSISLSMSFYAACSLPYKHRSLLFTKTLMRIVAKRW